jgi:NADH-quinone oxidoreductase subunit F
VCNAGEDEPGSYKDRVLLDHRPHLVLEGMILAARAIEAETVYLYLNETYHRTYGIISRAIAEARAAGYLNDVEVRIQKAPTVYVAGEDTASLEVIEGRDAKPRQKPPYPAVAGLYGKPTVVNNVETLANVPVIVRNGAAWFRRFGTPEQPGTMIFCLDDEMQRPNAYELAFGTPMRLLYENLGGGLTGGRRLKAILPGGPSCSFLTPEFLDTPMDPESFKRAGSSLGCGVMRFYAQGTCMVEVVLDIARFFARESCGQCPACRMETNMLTMLLERVQQGKGDQSLLDQCEKVLAFNRGKGYCALINMPGPPLLSAVRLFRNDFDHHMQHGTCPS